MAESNGICSEKIELLKKFTLNVYRQLLDENHLNNYTQKIFKQDHDVLHQQTQEHKNDWIVPYGKHLPISDYYNENENKEMPIVDASHLTHLDNTEISTAEHLENELQNLNARLVIVQHWLQYYLNKSGEAGVDGYRTMDLDVIEYFKSQLSYVNGLLHINTQILSEVLEKQPNGVDFPKEVDINPDFVGWFATKEHLNILVYANSALARLQKMCEENM